jgi:hypothetical protein
MLPSACLVCMHIQEADIRAALIVGTVISAVLVALGKLGMARSGLPSLSTGRVSVQAYTGSFAVVVIPAVIPALHCRPCFLLHWRQEVQYRPTLTICSIQKSYMPMPHCGCLCPSPCRQPLHLLDAFLVIVYAVQLGVSYRWARKHYALGCCLLP